MARPDAPSIPVHTATPRRCAQLATGLLLLTSKTTGKKSLGLAAAAGATLANCVKTITRADKVGLKKPGLAVWAVLQGAIALLALKNKD